MSRDDTPTCRNCVAFEPRIVEGNKAVDGFCRYYPPRPIRPDDSDERDNIPSWPVVEAEDFCVRGFTPKPHIPTFD